jgi:hypothetical protein
MTDNQWSDEAPRVAESQRTANALDRVRALHVPGAVAQLGQMWCDECGHSYPCLTIREVDR